MSDPARSPLWTRALAAAPASSCSRSRSTRPRRPPRRWAAASTTSSWPAAAGGAGAYHRKAGRTGRRAAHLDAGQHPHGRLGRRQRLHAHPGARPGRASRTRPSASPPSASGSTPPSASGPWASSTGVAGLANLLPTSVAVRLARQQVETVDFATSNVRGAPFPLYIAGARILANYPVGPTRRHGVEPHADVLRRPPRHGAQLRRGRGRRPGAAARRDRGRVRGAARRRQPRSGTPAAPKAGGARPRRARPTSGPDSAASSAAVSSMRTSSSRSETSSVDTSSRCISSESPLSMRRSASSITASCAFASASPVLVVTSSVSVIAATIPTPCDDQSPSGAPVSLVTCATSGWPGSGVAAWGWSTSAAGRTAPRWRSSA